MKTNIFMTHSKAPQLMGKLDLTVCCGRMYVVASGIGAIAWIVGLIAWIVVYTQNREEIFCPLSCARESVFESISVS